MRNERRDERREEGGKESDVRPVVSYSTIYIFSCVVQNIFILLLLMSCACRKDAQRTFVRIIV